MATLFTIPIPPLGAHPGGAVVCTEPAPQVYLLTLTSPPDNRLTTPTNAALLAALDLLELDPRYPPGVVLTTSSIQKFYSNGLDLEHALADPAFLPRSLYQLFLRFLTYPMPTVAVLNGHAFAGGLMLAMHHDYRVMSPSRGFLCINELDFGVPLKAPMSSIFRLKCTPTTYRSVVLEAKRFDGKAALEAGIVDALGGVEEAVTGLVEGRKLREKGRTGIYGVMKREMYRESVGLLSEEGFRVEEERFARVMDGEEKRREGAEGRVREILGRGEAKL